jgi:hypothetical protein
MNTLVLPPVVSGIAVKWWSGHVGMASRSTPLTRKEDNVGGNFNLPGAFITVAARAKVPVSLQQEDAKTAYL